MNFRIWLGGKTFSDQDILHLDPFSAGLSDYETHIFAFCKQWLRGEEFFPQQTSGSTGPPKQILLTRSQMLSSAQMTGKALQLREGNTALLCINAAMIGGKMMLIRAFELGLSLYVIAPAANPFLAFQKEYGNTLPRIDFFSLVPLQMLQLLDESPDALPYLNQAKAVILGGAAVDESLEEKIQQLQCPVYSTYGMTETVSHIALRKLNGLDKSKLFKALEGVSLQSDERDCLQVKASLTEDRWLATNDLVRLLDERHFEWLGRYDHVINSGGIKIIPEHTEKEIRHCLTALNIKANLLLLGIPDRKLGQKLVLLLEGRPLSEEILQNLKEKMQDKLPKYSIPKLFYFLEKFETNLGGKTDRKKTMVKLLESHSELKLDGGFSEEKKKQG